MIIEAVVVCVNYSDFLAHALPSMRGQFNKMVVVTNKKDKETAWLCEYYHVECVKTDAFYENGDTFNKGKAINEGLKRLTCEGWVVQIDADIYLPPLTRYILEKIPLNPKKIYGIDRMMCPSFEEWIDFICTPKKIHEGWVYIHTTAYPMGVRIGGYHEDGYYPIGFFQLWNPKGSGIKDYPTTHKTAARSDMLHAQQFSRENRELLPEIICIHLESEKLDVDSMGKNWAGRKTKKFVQGKKCKKACPDQIEIIFEEIFIDECTKKCY